MNIKIARTKDYISLIIDNPEKENDRHVLAAMTLFEGTGCWKLTDILLSPSRKPSLYSCALLADDQCAYMKPERTEDAAKIKEMLREYQELDDGTLLWCTFDGIVRGSPEINGYAPPRWAGFDQSGYFSLSDGLDYLHEAKAVYDTIEGGFDGNIEPLRIPNLYLQPSISEVRFRLIADRLDALPSP